MCAKYLVVCFLPYPYGKSLYCKPKCFASFWLIVLMDPVDTAPENVLF